MRKISFFLLVLFANTFAEIFNDKSFLIPVVQESTEAEIAAYAKEHQMLFVAGDEDLNIFHFQKDKKIEFLKKLEMPESISSVSVFKNLLAIAMPGNTQSELRFYKIEDKSIQLLSEHSVCAGLDNVVFTPNGKWLLGACEGEPSDDYLKDPEGKIILVKIKENFEFQELTFTHLDSAALLKAGVRNPGKSNFYQSLEPEYIAITEDSKKAFASLQENNAIAVINLETEKIDSVFPLGALNHSLKGNEIVVQSKKEILFENLPLLSLRQPDGLATWTENGNTFIITANEGASIETDVFSDVEKIADKLSRNELEPTIFNDPVLKSLKKKELAKDSCVKNKKGKCEAVYSFGSRSVSIFDISGNLIYDSQNSIEKKIAEIAPTYFNWNSKKGKQKINARSKTKGIEPENVVIAKIKDKRFAFIALERMSGIFVLDISDLKNIQYAGYYLDTTHRGPEGLLFIPKEENPWNTPLLIVCYEYSKNLVLYQIKE